MQLIRSIATLAATACGLILMMAILRFPFAALQAAANGMAIWWDVLFPALFPFLAVSEILLGLGVVHFLGTLFDPVMRPLFRVPGIGGFVMAMGFISGYPVASRLTVQLHRQGLVTRVEGERLVAFCSTADPIFLIGAVSVGFFHNAAIAPVLAAAHYGGAVLVGALMRMYRPEQRFIKEERSLRAENLWANAFCAMLAAKEKDGRNFGKLLQDAIVHSLKLVMMIGGLVVFFAVLLRMLQEAGIMDLLLPFFGQLLALCGLSSVWTEAVMNGLLEVTLGAQASAVQASGAMLKQGVALAAFILSWSGLSVHAQICSIMGEARLRYAPFFAARLAHGVLGAAIALALSPWLL